jgi:hypothetical protein
MTGTTYNTGYFFSPAVTQAVVGSGTYYGWQFSGGVSVAATTLPAGTATPTRWYSGLTINVNTGTGRIGDQRRHNRRPSA